MSFAMLLNAREEPRKKTAKRQQGANLINALYADGVGKSAEYSGGNPAKSEIEPVRISLIT